MYLKKVARAKLPTKWGNFLIFGFEELLTKNNHVAIVYGKINSDSPILVRIHSECLTGDALYSLRCDCGFQLEASLSIISKVGNGILLYHRQEGRNIGLLNKIKAYCLQDQGHDTVDANRILGFSEDERDFKICVDMLNILGVKKIRLLTNNPCKVLFLSQAGINVVERIPLVVGNNPKNYDYLHTKFNKMGHLI
ncbi:GTP cyclohydrolase II [Candidatus Purcelliella pentastirinorum]|nr:GTP cyclohydrolase II [Candidatus Purcelliella pentastirinorum]WDI78876.1 GTP cyclohydrolase II [Candidatus Purcelliella pentastirinorum]WDR80009.1 GTP cyclohydrolase II [Candidatus Purcelliella pentastirinorum]